MGRGQASEAGREAERAVNPCSLPRNEARRWQDMERVISPCTLPSSRHTGASTRVHTCRFLGGDEVEAAHGDAGERVGVHQLPHSQVDACCARRGECAGRPGEGVCVSGAAGWSPGRSPDPPAHRLLFPHTSTQRQPLHCPPTLLNPLFRLTSRGRVGDGRRAAGGALAGGFALGVGVGRG